MNIGDKFGFWAVAGTEEANRANGYLIDVRCVCGSNSKVSAKYLRTGRSESCGCRGVFVGTVLADGSKVIAVHHTGKAREVSVRCECGEVRKSRLDGGGVRSHCPACYARDCKHGESSARLNSKEYRAWKGMRFRCSDSGLPDYAGRGITVCKQWSDFTTFLADVGRAPSESHSIDRIEVNGNYEPSNCRWATASEQMANRRPPSEWKRARPRK